MSHLQLNRPNDWVVDAKYGTSKGLISLIDHGVAIHPFIPSMPEGAWSRHGFLIPVKSKK